MSIQDHAYEIRRIQALTGERSLTLVLPKHYASDLGLNKGDYVKVKQEQNKLVIQKAD